MRRESFELLLTGSGQSGTVGVEVLVLDPIPQGVRRWLHRRRYDPTPQRAAEERFARVCGTQARLGLQSRDHRWC